MIVPDKHQEKMQAWRYSWFTCAVLLPWMAPPLWGPSPGVVPWLVTIVCIALLLLTSCQDTDGSTSLPTAAAQAWLLAAVLNSLIGLHQYLALDKCFWPWLFDARPGVAYGSLFQRNHFATLTNIGVAALIYVRLHLRDVNVWRDIGLSALAALLAIGNAASASRTGLLGLLLVIGLTIVWGRWRERWVLKVLIPALIAYAAASWLLPMQAGGDAESNSVYARFTSTAPDCASRLNLWSNMLELINKRPWLGWGWGELDFAHFTSDYSGLRQCERIDNAHNLPLHLAVVFGVPVAVLMTGASVWLIARARPWREKEPVRQMAWLVLALIVLHSMVEYPLWFGPFAMTAALCLLLLGKQDQRCWPMVTLGGKVLGGSLLLVAAYATWDYHGISQIYLEPDQRAPVFRENTLEKIRGSWLFSDQVLFAEYTLTPLTRDNAEQLYAMGLQLLHYSPEAQVVEKLIESAVLLGRDEEARFYLARYKAAYPQDHANWAAGQREPDGAP